MGAIGGLIGLGGGQLGTGVSTNSGVGSSDIQTALTNSNQDRAQQQALLKQLEAQHALSRQSNVYDQYQNIAAGKGPNPAQAMLNQSTGQNVANQAALMAGQRGAGSNVGLMARQAAHQGANIQQQAAGQAATMQANQSLNAIGQAGNMANTMAANRVGQTNSNINASQNQQNILQGANSAYNQTQGQLVNTQLQGQQGFIAGQMNAASNMMSMGMGAAHGGEVPKRFDVGGMVPQQPPAPPVAPEVPGAPIAAAPVEEAPIAEPVPVVPVAPLTPEKSAFGAQSMFAQNLKPVIEPAPMMYESTNPGAEELKTVGSKGGKPKMPSGAMGGNVGSQLKKGGHVPGQASVKGNSYENDTVKALLSPGEVVIPKSVMESKDPIRGAAEFVRSVMAKKGKMA